MQLLSTQRSPREHWESRLQLGKQKFRTQLWPEVGTKMQNVILQSVAVARVKIALIFLEFEDAQTHQIQYVVLVNV